MIHTHCNVARTFGKTRRSQRGAYLLEALIGILIFSFGILGIVGLQAQAIRFTNDSEYRAEAVYLANGLISQMWTDNQATLQAKYSSSPPGVEYLNFKTLKVQPALGAMMTTPPEVLVNDALLPAPPSKTSSVVRVTIYWTLPGDGTEHHYTTTGVV